ncbi:MAG: hypothetical protein HY902_14250, partial [Deltaproteobacteria bacterium]|nr:hypothetical protein [Deltaproteobacteria bacterium]
PREILRRRAAFIRTSLLGVGVLASLTDCGADACLSMVAAVDTSDADAAVSEVQVCLTQDIPDTPDAADSSDGADDTPQICLSPRDPDAFDTSPDVCLSDVGSLPDADDALDDAPQVCLKIAPDAVDDAPQICLSPPAPDASEPG